MRTSGDRDVRSRYFCGMGEVRTGLQVPPILARTVWRFKKLVNVDRADAYRESGVKMVRPPSTGRQTPVTKSLSTKNNTAWAMFSGLPVR